MTSYDIYNKYLINAEHKHLFKKLIKPMNYPDWLATKGQKKK